MITGFGNKDIQKVYLRRIEMERDWFRALLPSEEEIGFLIFKRMMNYSSKKNAETMWSGGKYGMAMKKRSLDSAKAIHDLMVKSVKGE